MRGLAQPWPFVYTTTTKAAPPIALFDGWEAGTIFPIPTLVLVDAFWLKNISDNVGRWKTIVCRWHDPGGIQGDGKHSHLERRHHRELRACGRSPNRKSINLRRIAGVSEAGARSRNPELFLAKELRPGWPGLLILRTLPTQWEWGTRRSLRWATSLRITIR